MAGHDATARNQDGEIRKLTQFVGHGNTVGNHADVVEILDIRRQGFHGRTRIQKDEAVVA